MMEEEFMSYLHDDDTFEPINLAEYFVPEVTDFIKRYDSTTIVLLNISSYVEINVDYDVNVFKNLMPRYDFSKSQREFENKLGNTFEIEGIQIDESWDQNEPSKRTIQVDMTNFQEMFDKEDNAHGDSLKQRTVALAGRINGQSVALVLKFGDTSIQIEYNNNKGGAHGVYCRLHYTLQNLLDDEDDENLPV